MSYHVFVVEEHPTIKDLHVSSKEHYFEYDVYSKALAHFNSLVESNEFDWIELKDEDADYNDHDGLGLCWQKD